MRQITVSDVQRLEMINNGLDLIIELQKIGAIAREKQCQRCGGYMKVSQHFKSLFFRISLFRQLF